MLLFRLARVLDSRLIGYYEALEAAQHNGVGGGGG